MRASFVVLPVAVLLLLAGCSAQPTPEPSAAPTAQRTEVDWDEYPPSTQQIIDDAQSEGDCVTLQGMFDVADQAGFLDQMKYIDEALELAGCYE